MRIRQPRVRHTAGSRGWARTSGQTYDPAADPTSVQNQLRLDPAAVSKTRTLEPADLIERAERLGATSRPAAHQKTMIYPPDKSQPPVSISPRFGNGHDRMNAIANLRKAGLDVINDPRLNGTAVVGQPKPTDMPGRIRQAVQPTGSQIPMGDDPEAPGEPEDTPVSWSDVEGLFEMLEERDQRLERQSKIQQLLEDHIHELQDTVQQLAGGLDGLRLRVKELESNAPVPVEKREQKYTRIGEAAVKLLRAMPSGMTFTMGQIADGAQLADEDRGSPLATAVRRRIEQGEIRTHGKGSGMTYSIGHQE